MIWAFLRAYLERIVVVCAAAGLAFLGVAGSSELKAFVFSPRGRLADGFFLVLVVAEVISMIRSHGRTQQIESARILSSENARLKQWLSAREGAISNLVAGQLALLAGTIDFHESERITLYKHRADDSFKVVGRYSQHQEHTRTRREIIPAHEGIVARAWASQNMESLVINADPTTNSHEYAAEQHASCNVPAQTTAQFRMKSRFYMAIPIKEYDGAHHSPGVLVLESLSATRFSSVTQLYGMRQTVRLQTPGLQLCLKVADENH